MTRFGFLAPFIAAMLILSFVVASCGGGGGASVTPPPGNSGPSQTNTPGGSDGKGFIDVQDSGGIVSDPAGRTSIRRAHKSDTASDRWRTCSWRGIGHRGITAIQ
jgi:hypothetical protein